MISVLARIFVKDQDVSKPEVREKFGILCGGVGVGLNILLCIIKIIAGNITGAVSIVADAINNISDAGSSIIMMVGFKMAGKKADPDHPFGHGRVEYVTGLIVSLAIILMGVELVKSSVMKILHPSPVEFSIVAIVILAVSILVKIYMFAYNNSIGTKVSSAVMKATARDSISDAVSTAVVLACMFITKYSGISVDGMCGLMVAAFILFTGFSSAKDTLDPLLGSKPSKEYVELIEKFVTSHESIIGVHDLIVHDYGPGRVMISLHAEVPSTGDMMELHDTIDNIEQKLATTLGCQAVIHMDPVVVDDEATDQMRRLVKLIVKSVDETLSMHDFRMVPGTTHTNLIFDVVLPFEVPMTEEEVKEIISEKVRELPGNHYAVIQIDRPYA